MKAKWMKYVKISVMIIISLLLFSGIAIPENKNKNDDWSQVGHDARHTYKSSVTVNEDSVGVLWKKDWKYYYSGGKKTNNLRGCTGDEELVYYNKLLFVSTGDRLYGIELI